MQYLGFKQGGRCLYVASAECPGDETVFVFQDGDVTREVCATCLARFLTEHGTAIEPEQPEEWIALLGTREEGAPSSLDNPHPPDPEAPAPA